MSDQSDQNLNRIKKLLPIVPLLVGLASVATFLLSILQSKEQAVEVAQIDQGGYVILPNEGFAEQAQSVGTIWLDPNYPHQDSTCAVSEIGIPLVRHPHWPGSQLDAQSDFYGGAFMHDLFFRANCT